MQGIDRGEDWVVLKGNHDRMFVRFLNDPMEPEPGLRADLSWLRPKLGGPDTLASYGVRNAADRPVAKVHADALAAVPQAHRDFLEDMMRRYEVPPLPESTSSGGGDRPAPMTLNQASQLLDVAFAHPISLIANALGPPPKEMLDRAEHSSAQGGLSLAV